MKVSRIIVIVVLILIFTITLISVGVGCNSVGEGGAIDMMKRIPYDSEIFQFLDMDTIRTDNDLEDLYIGFEDSTLAFTDNMGIDSDEVERVAFGKFNTIQIEGYFNLENLREDFTVRGLSSDEYNGVEIWGDGAIAFVSNELIIANFFGGDVKDYINVIEDIDTSLYENKDFKDIIERLPYGIFIMCEKGAFPINGYEYDGLKVAGSSLRKKDKHIMAITGVGKFETADAASDSINRIKDDLENDENAEWNNIDIRQDDGFIIVTTEWDIEGMFGPVETITP
jgi:hypothetical protein